ncbi:hypothetical protein HPP92_026832 [Vanilla planifolia]|uniref:Uncharacterized protein n=1 Tax=Vanilla planifolia TaxID=51239 RepID=A0A835PDM1_VANPL|nr:hypothetical protein HPP92_026832 [Vanilla planifolia]
MEGENECPSSENSDFLLRGAYQNGTTAQCSQMIESKPQRLKRAFIEPKFAEEIPDGNKNVENQPEIIMKISKQDWEVDKRLFIQGYNFHRIRGIRGGYSMKDP